MRQESIDRWIDWAWTDAVNLPCVPYILHLHCILSSDREPEIVCSLLLLNCSVWAFVAVPDNVLTCRDLVNSKCEWLMTLSRVLTTTAWLRFDKATDQLHSIVKVTWKVQADMNCTEVKASFYMTRGDIKSRFFSRKLLSLLSSKAGKKCWIA